MKNLHLSPPGEKVSSTDKKFLLLFIATLLLVGISAIIFTPIIMEKVIEKISDTRSKDPLPFPYQ